MLAEEAEACGVDVVLADDALQALLVYRWPGNLRQLRQVLRYACAVSEVGQVRLLDLPQAVRGEAVVSSDSGVSCPARQLLLDALIRHRWKPADAARALGISRATLYRRVHEHCIEMPRMKG